VDNCVWERFSCREAMIAAVFVLMRDMAQTSVFVGRRPAAPP
jgi:hypothetical protein